MIREEINKAGRGSTVVVLSTVLSYLSRLAEQPNCLLIRVGMEAEEPIRTGCAKGVFPKKEVGNNLNINI